MALRVLRVLQVDKRVPRVDRQMERRVLRVGRRVPQVDK